MSDDEGAGFESMVAEDPYAPDPQGGARPDRVAGADVVSPAGASVTVADLPLVVASGDAEACVGVLSYGWAGEHEVSTSEETLLVAVADLAAAAMASFRTSSMATERAEWFERVAHTDPLTGLSNGRTLGRSSSSRSPGRSARAARSRSRCSTSTASPRLNEASASRAGDQVLRQVAAVLRRRFGWWTRSPGPAATSSSSWRRDRRASRSPARARGDRKLESIEGHPVSISAGIARFPQDGSDAESLLAAARAALAGAGGNATIAEAVGPRVGRRRRRRGGGPRTLGGQPD